MDKYLTMFYGIIEWSNNLLRYSSGGQFPFPILFDGQQASYVGKKACRSVCSICPLSDRIAAIAAAVRHGADLDGILETLLQTSLRDKQAFLLELIGGTDLTIENPFSNWV